MNINGLTDRIKESLTERELDDFTGFGVVIVERDFKYLPISPLLDKSNIYLRVETVEAVISFLFEASKPGDKRHDGFHVYNPEQGLIAVSQYFSPKIPNVLKDVVYNVGARVRAAQYGSLCNGVLEVITVGNSGEIHRATNGIIEQV